MQEVILMTSEYVWSERCPILKHCQISNMSSKTNVILNYKWRHRRTNTTHHQPARLLAAAPVSCPWHNLCLKIINCHCVCLQSLTCPFSHSAVVLHLWSKKPRFSLLGGLLIVWWREERPSTQFKQTACVLLAWGLLVCLCLYCPLLRQVKEISSLLSGAIKEFMEFSTLHLWSHECKCARLFVSLLQRDEWMCIQLNNLADTRSVQREWDAFRSGYHRP